MSVEVIDFGCRLNFAEGATLKRLLADEHDLIVVNSCAVTAEATRQARQAVRRAAARRPDARIVVTGCAVATDAARFAAMPGVAIATTGQLLSRNSDGIGSPSVTGPDHARAFVEVQNGCDHDCTFCVTTLARGVARSFAPAAIVDAVAAAVARGHNEIVLTGVDLTSYRPSLASLVATILREVPALPRLRLSSLDPSEVDDALIGLFASEARLMPHVHLSLQSGDALTLKRMKRRHTPEQAVRLVERLKASRPGIAIGADLIAGFPTESEAMHANSCAALDACDIVLAHVFPYSPRAETAAARMPQVAPEVARVRASELRKLAATRKSAWLRSLIGTTQPVLVELSGLRGHTPGFAPVRLTAAQSPKAIATTYIVGSEADHLIGEAA